MSHSDSASSVPGMAPITVDDLIGTAPDIGGHINGGTTSLPEADVLSASLNIQRLAAENGALDRAILGSDTPSGAGVMPLAIIRRSPSCRPSAEFPRPTSSPTRPATLRACCAGRRTREPPDRRTEPGDITGIASVITNGQIRALRSRNSPAPIREVEVQPHR